MSKIVLYDLPSNGHCACWSYNPWKTRLALNFKNLDYETEWLEYPDVASKLKSCGIPPNTDGTAYTIPAIRLQDGKYVMDSKKIAAALDAAHPEPSLRLDSPVVAKVDAAITQLFGAVGSDLRPRVPAILNQKSVGYFEETRAKRLGTTLAAVLKEKGGDPAWEKAKPHLEAIVSLLQENQGPFFLGEDASYADFYLLSVMQFAKRLGRLDKFLSFDPAFEKTFEAGAQYLQKQT